MLQLWLWATVSTSIAFLKQNPSLLHGNKIRVYPVHIKYISPQSSSTIVSLKGKFRPVLFPVLWNQNHRPNTLRFLCCCSHYVDPGGLHASCRKAGLELTEIHHLCFLSNGIKERHAPLNAATKTLSPLSSHLQGDKSASTSAEIRAVALNCNTRHQILYHHIISIKITAVGPTRQLSH